MECFLIAQIVEFAGRKGRSMKLDQETIAHSLQVRKRAIFQRDEFTRAAVLIPVFDRGDQTLLLFTHRTETVSTHKGEISFPGGSIDPADRDPEMTALREAEEEVGITATQVSVVGYLDDITTITHYLVTPVVGFIDPPESFRPNPREIQRVLEIPVESFLDPDVFRVETELEFEGKPYPVYYFDLPKETIWGATARILKQFLEISCGWVPPAGA